MAQPRILFQILRLPAGARYVSRTDDRFDLTADRFGMPAGSFTYASRGLDHFFPGRSLPYRIGYRSNNYFDFRLVLKLNEVCGWSYSEDFAPNDPRMMEMVAAARAPDAFMVWYLADEGDDWGSLADYLAGNTAGVAYDPTQDVTTFPAAVQDAPTAFAERGGGGLIMDVHVQAGDDGAVRVTVEGTCWAQALEETRQTKVDGKQRTEGIGAGQGLWSLLGDTLFFNAEYEQDTITTESENEDGETIQTALQLPDRVVTPIGRWLVQVTMGQRALVDLAGDETVYYEDAGDHTVLEAFQRLAEARGLVFHTNQPVILFDKPGGRNLTWRPQHFQSAEISYHRPRATSIVVTHRDYARDWTIHAPIEELRDAYGNIQLSERSLAHIAQDAETAAELGLEGAEGDEHIWEVVSNQVAATAIREAAVYSAAAQMRWQPGSRYGLDWRLGDEVRLNFSTVADNDMTLNPATTIRQATISQSADGTVSIQAGLGATSDLVPMGGAEVSAAPPRRIR